VHLDFEVLLGECFCKHGRRIKTQMLMRFQERRPLRLRLFKQTIFDFELRHFRLDGDEALNFSFEATFFFAKQFRISLTVFKSSIFLLQLLVCSIEGLNPLHLLCRINRIVA
jgi:hypothetical protein